MRTLYIAIAFALLLAPALSGATIIDTIGGIGSSSFISSGYMWGFPITASASGTLNSIGVNIINATGNVQVAMYSFSGSSGSRLGNSVSTPATTGWEDLPVNGITIHSGTQYLLVVQSSSESIIQETSAMNNIYYKINAYGNFPASATWSSFSFTTWNMRMIYTLVKPIANAITPSAPAIDNGQSITLMGGATSGVPPYTYAWYSGSSCTGSVLGTATTQSVNPSTTTAYCMVVTDSLGSTANAIDTVAINSAPSISSGPGSGSYIYGSPITQTATILGGTSQFTYNQIIYSAGYPIYSSNTGLTSATTNEIIVPYATLGTGTFTYNVMAHDSSAAGTVAFNSPTYTFTLYSLLSANAIIPTSPNIYYGQPISLLAGATGGTPPYTYTWYATSCSGAVLSTSQTFTSTPLSTITYCVKITDSATASNTASDLVSVGSALSASSSPASQVITKGESATINGLAANGYPPYSYQWLATSANGDVWSANQANDLLGGTAQTATAAFQTNSLTTPGVYGFELEVMDSAQSSAIAANANVIISSLSIALNAIPNYELNNVTIAHLNVTHCIGCGTGGAAQIETGNYSGNGGSQMITLNFTPVFLMIYQTGDSIFGSGYEGQSCEIQLTAFDAATPFAFTISPTGTSWEKGDGVAIVPGGFTVQSSGGELSMCNFNQGALTINNQTYDFVAWG